MLDKMPGDAWQKYATLRALYGFMYGHPGKKLLFMGDEFGQWREWNHDRSLDWHLLDDPRHAGLRALRAGAELALPRGAGAAPGRLRSRRLPLDRLQRQREQRRLVPALRARSPRFRGDGVQLHAGAARGYRIGVPAAGLLRRAAEQRQRACTAAATSATAAASSPSRFPRTASTSRCASWSRRSGVCC